MSLNMQYSDAFYTAKAQQGSVDMEARENLALLTRYLAILEDNRRASQFVPDDAALALDMAGFVRNRLQGERHPARTVSTGRLALSLVQRCIDAPVQ